MALVHKTEDDVKRVGKHYQDGQYWEIPAILDNEGEVDESASEKILDKLHYDDVTPFIIKETTIHPYIDAQDVGEI